MSDAKLSVKEQLFVEAYLGKAKGNGTEACRIAGYKGNDGVLNVQAVRLLRKAKVQQFLAEQLKKFEITTDNVLKGIASIAFNTAEKSSDRNKAFELLGKYLKLFSENIVHSGEVNHNHAVSFDEWKQKADSRLQEVLETND